MGEFFDTKEGDSGGKVHMLGGDSIDHCENKSFYEHVSNFEWSPGNRFLMLQIQTHCES
jgi:hypothetical protein